MAKKEKLSLDELLEQAILKDGDKPYGLPNNWLWTWMKTVSDVRDGTHDSPKYVDKGYPLVTSKNLRNGKIDFTDIQYISQEDHDNINKRSKVDSGDILYAMIGTIGNPVLVENMDIDFSIKNVALFKPDSRIINHKYLLYYLDSSLYDLVIKKDLKGSTQKFIALGKLRESLIVLPPLPEQQRIVELIESLFEMLDRAKELVQNALDSFEERKSAILHKAFTGELTKQWRDEHLVDMNSWTEKTIAQLCEAIVDCPHSTPQWTTKGRICLRTTNIKAGYLDFSEVRFVSEKTFEQRIERLKPRSGDILFTREGNVGDVGVVTDDFEICMGQRMMLMRPLNDVPPNFIVYYLQSPRIIEFMNQKTGGSTSPHMNVKEIKQIIVSTPSLPELQEIVNVLDSLLEQEKRAKELSDVIDNIGLLKKSILARAFRGELCTNNPDEESALVLLKEVLRERVKQL